MNKNIEALLAERVGYVNRNLPERVKAVDAALRELGFENKLLTETPVETASISVDTETTSLNRGKKKKE